jgi:hypothetical protein
MTLYRIYTETKPNLGEIVSRTFESFTILQGTGYWKGQSEESSVIEVMAHDERGKVQDLARVIRSKNEQQAVLVVEVEVKDAYNIEQDGNAWLI